MNAGQVLVKPLITERSMALRDDHNKYAFQVHVQATNPEIRKAVEELFEVKVTSVHTLNMLGKNKRLGRFMGRRSSWKKAIVGIAAGQTIDIYEAV
jgi:large subunit ribosomal protein L23